MKRSDVAERFAKVPTWVWFVLALLLQLAIIGQMVVAHYTSAAAGSPVVLKIAPMDPRDPLRGDYLTFRYDISRLPRSMFTTVAYGHEWKPTKGQIVYVPLVRGEKYWEPTEPVSRTLPKRSGQGSATPGSAYLRGAVTDVGPELVTITYGIEEYFVPEGKGASFPLWKQASAQVLIAPDGVGHLKQVYVGGKAWP